MKKRAFALPLAAVILITGCATVPSGPSVMVLPGTGKGFDQFQSDDYACRAWATQNVGSPGDTATRRTVTGAAVGTLLGAAAGAAIGAAAGSPGTGAAVGAGVGVLGGSAAGASAAQPAYGYGSPQRQYDSAYMQCMYAKGHQIPVARGSLSGYSSQPPPPPPPAPMPKNVPMPPMGTPPPPPPGATR